MKKIIIVLLIFVPIISCCQKISNNDVYGRWKDILGRNCLGFGNDNTFQIYDSDTSKTGVLKHKFMFELLYENKINYIVFYPNIDKSKNKKFKISMCDNKLIINDDQMELFDKESIFEKVK